MKKTILISFILLGISSFALAKETCAVAYITDGDTIKCKLNNELITIRLANIDAPETTQDFGLESKEMLMNLIKPSKLIDFESTKKDRYGRHIAEIFVLNKNLNLEMVKLGGAWAYKEYLDKNKATTYLNAEQKARSSRSGLWSLPVAIYPSDFRKNKKSTHKSEDKIPKQNTNNGYNCVKKTCKQIASCEEAYYLLNQCGFSRLDRDKDGMPCEILCN